MLLNSTCLDLFQASQGPNQASLLKILTLNQGANQPLDRELTKPSKSYNKKLVKRCLGKMKFRSTNLWKKTLKWQRTMTISQWVQESIHFTRCLIKSLNLISLTKKDHRILWSRLGETLMDNKNWMMNLLIFSKSKWKLKPSIRMCRR